MSETEPYNPLAKKHLGESVADALLRGEPTPLGDIPDFTGAGIYAIYYSGGFRPYAPIARFDQSDHSAPPIYVGKAIPAGARKGNVGLGNNPGRVLSARLREHAKSIKLAENIDIADFYCRFLVVEDIWIPLGENLLITRFSPLWNKIVDGFGNHDPGAGRYEQEQSRWDVLHPGRPWAVKCRERPETAAQIITELESYLRDLLS